MCDLISDVITCGVWKLRFV